MEKILKKYTIIPEHLYVNRDADTQLKRIIEDMQRPGYVLVARQMGKTNLLFHAKRILESENRLFVYVDLSNLYDNERDCYRNIINSVTEPNLSLFESIIDEIEKIRTNNLPPHNEYTRCLRVVLKHFKGDIVIVLDEIDALKSIDYSDNIFAQIRSNYFSRTNFPEFERLTYVLSGVIEPTELIKDRNKSPFNIGDKIYLDDFTKDEHDDFVRKSNLQITKEISDEIFNWASGNPRITFDICSELENQILKGEKVGNELLEKIINKKYLTTFDIAPVDHIRELVKTNKEIRSSISLIHKKQSSHLSDDIKRKLYLYGVISSNFNEEIRIKNKIIQQSLSEEWIKSIDKEQQLTLVKGFVKYDTAEFNEAIEIFLDIISDPDSSNYDIEASNYFLGLSYYRLHEFQKAAEYFSRDYSNVEHINDAKLYLGICKLASGSKEEGILILEESTRDETNNLAYYSALLNLATHLDDKHRAANILIELYEGVHKAKDIKEADIKQFKTLSLYYQAELLLKDSNTEKALNKINQALEISDKSLSLSLIFLKYQLSINKDESLKTCLVNEIIDNNLTFDSRDDYPISFKENLLYLYLDFVFDDSNLELFEKLLNYSVTKLLPNLDKYEIIYNTISTGNSNKLSLLNYLIKFEEQIDEKILIDVYWNLAINQLNNKHKYFEAFNKYLNFFVNTNRITADDIYLFGVSCKFYYESENFFESIKLCKIIEPRLAHIEDENLKLESTIIYYWCSISYFRIKDRFNAKNYAEMALNIISNSNKKTTSLIDEKGLSGISEQLHQIKYSSTTNPPIISSKKYGRNEKVRVKYLDGREVESKYKMLETDILAGRCKVIQ